MSIPARLLACVASLALAPAAFAIPITWTRENTASQYVADGATITFTHDLAAEEFVAGADIVTSFLLTVYLSDELDDASAAFELAFLDPRGVRGDDFLFGFNNGSAAFSGASLAGLFQLNLLGTLTVSIISVSGDFQFDRSVLVANGVTDGVALPKPPAVALFAIGLMIVGFRRFASSR